LARGVTGAKDGLNTEAAYENDLWVHVRAIASGPGISRDATAEEGASAA
jgi:hypothetical protein